MEIQINQKKIQVGDKYQIAIDGQPAYAASRELSELQQAAGAGSGKSIRLLPVLRLCKEGGQQPEMTISKQYSIWKPLYQLTRPHDNPVEFRTISFWKLHYQCQFGPDLYDVYGHKGRKYSIYKNGRQVAWWDKAAAGPFEGSQYVIIADGNCDIAVITSFCMIIDDLSSDNYNGNNGSIDLGNVLGLQARKFDENWQPAL